MTPVPDLAFSRTGAGEPLVLLHGLGLSRDSWEPVVPLLADRFDVIAIDLPGFGASAPLPDDVEPHPAALAAVVAKTLSDLGVDRAHVVGNSLGGWVALELVAMVPIRSLTLLSPAGLWRDRTPLYNRVSLRTTRILARYLGWLLRPLVASRIARAMVLGQGVGRPARMSVAQARSAISNVGRCPGFRETLRATLSCSYVGPAQTDAPVAVSFGTRDLILLPWQSRHLDRLPAQTRVVPLAGTGHVPMTDDPPAVAALISRTAGWTP